MKHLSKQELQASIKALELAGIETGIEEIYYCLGKDVLARHSNKGVKYIWYLDDAKSIVIEVETLKVLSEAEAENL